MRSRQAGITFIGWVVLLVPVAIVAYGAIRLTPVYLNYMKVTKAMKQTAEESGGGQVSPVEVRKSLEKRLDIESVNYPAVDDIAVTRDGDNWVMAVDLRGQGIAVRRNLVAGAFREACSYRMTLPKLRSTPG